MNQKNYPENKAERIWIGESLYNLFGIKILKKKITCCLVYQERLGHYCGHVRFPEKFLEEEGHGGILNYVPVHGGITYSKQDDDGMVYGFDCGHGGDEDNPNLKNIEYLKKECEKMAVCIREAQRFENRFNKSTGEKREKVINKYLSFLKDKYGFEFDLYNNFGAMISVLSGNL